MIQYGHTAACPAGLFLYCVSPHTVFGNFFRSVCGRKSDPVYAFMNQGSVDRLK